MRTRSSTLARRDEAIAQAVRQGLSIKGAALRWGVSGGVVYAACRKQGLTFGRGGDVGAQAWAAAHYWTIARAVREGGTLAEVGERFGVSPGSIYRICRKAGLKFGSQGNAGPSAERAKVRRAIAATAASGEDAASLARRFGRSLTSVRGACAEHGVRLDRPPNHKHARAVALRPRLSERDADRAAAALPPNIRPVVRLLLSTTLTLAEIGEACGVSRQRVHQVWRSLQFAEGAVKAPAG